MDKSIHQRCWTLALVLAAALAGVQARPAVAAAPVAVYDHYTVAAADGLVLAAPGILANDADPDGDPLTAVLYNPPAHGVLLLGPNGALVYDPDPGFNGWDQFLYQATDGTDKSTITPVTIVVNSPPVAVADDYLISPDAPLLAPAPGVLGNDYDADGGWPTATLTYGVTFGTLTFAGAGGNFTYTPPPGFQGVDGFGYQACDGFVCGNLAYVTITVGTPPAPPFAVDDVFTIQQDNPTSIPAPGVLANDYDDNGDPMTSATVTPPAHGKLVMGGDGDFYYAPDPGFAGIDTFTYWAGDGVQFGNVATVTLVVEAAPDATGDGERGSESADCRDPRQLDATRSQDCR